MRAALQGRATAWGWPDPVLMGRLWYILEGDILIAQVVIAKEMFHGKPVRGWWCAWCSACPGYSTCEHMALCPVPQHDRPL